MKKFAIRFILTAFVYSQIHSPVTTLAEGIVNEYGLEDNAIVIELTELAGSFN